MHIADWLATFAAITGVDPTDHKAAADPTHLPPIGKHILVCAELI
jgi:hypothetical protein